MVNDGKDTVMQDANGRNVEAMKRVGPKPCSGRDGDRRRGSIFNSNKGGEASIYSIEGRSPSSEPRVNMGPMRGASSNMLSRHPAQRVYHHQQP